MAMDPQMSMGAVRLRVADLDRAKQFYEQVIGLAAGSSEDGVVTMRAGVLPWFR